jgi:hypothetical protein
MTRAELKQKRLNEENEKIKELKGKLLNEDQKNWFRKTKIWTSFRKLFENKGVKKFKNGKEKPIKEVDFLTGNPLKKGFNLHHMRLDPRLYTDLEKEFFIPLNSQSHDVLHWIHTQRCKDPKFMERLIELSDRMYELNEGKDVKDFK